jgi:glycosyltransferase involved in cell wall biosynthesis
MPTQSPESSAASRRHIAYVSLQAVAEGQDTWAAVTEIIAGIEAEGWTVDPYFPEYDAGAVPGPWRRLWEMWRLQARLAKRLGEYDALYVRAHPLAWRISTLAHRRGVPVVQECNGPYEDLFIAWPSTRVARPLFEHLQRSQYRRASAIISVAQGLTEWLIAETGNPHVVTNGNGANVEVFRPDAPRRPGLPDEFAVFFGQFPAWQGIPTLLEAAGSPEWPTGLKLVLVGDGALRPEIELAEETGGGRIVYLGRLPYHEVARVAAHALVSYVPMVAPEREARFSPLKLYESMACGVPVIASDTIGISEIVRDADCGLLVTPGDAAGIVAATNRLYADSDLAAEMGRLGREAALTRYSWPARARQRREIVEAAIERAADSLKPGGLS